jgi:phospho-N-acetylmuramoyl-pentapeptide-transferase
LALGGALTAMAAFTGMFFPLLIASGIFIVESSSLVLQVCSMLVILPCIDAI